MKFAKIDNVNILTVTNTSVYDIQLDNHHYFAANGIISHNCRLKNKIQTKEFNFTNGNIGVQTGSKSVITLNLSRMLQDWWRIMKKGNEDIKKEDLSLYYNDLKEYIKAILERVYKYHTAYNELLWDMYEAGLLPVYKSGFIDLNKQYLTIGLNGLNQAAEFFGIDCNLNSRYEEFCQTLFGFIKEMNLANSGVFNGHKLTYNTECVPRAVGTLNLFLLTRNYLTNTEIRLGQRGASNNVCMLCAA